MKNDQPKPTLPLTHDDPRPLRQGLRRPRPATPLFEGLTFHQGQAQWCDGASGAHQRPPGRI
jgi:hypothetical protein